MARRFPQKVHDFIAANVTGRTTRELTVLVNERFDLGFTESSMKSYKTNHHLKSGTPSGLPAGHCSDIFPQAVCEYIRKNYAGVGPSEMAAKLNTEFGASYTAAQLKGFYGNHKLNSGVTGYFEKGSAPPNKGRKGFYASGSEKGWFKKGNLPHDTKPVGYERITKDGYVEVKIKMRPSRQDCNDNFVAKHRLIWEKANGSIPEGYIVIFKDGNKQNFDLDNLALITLSEHQMLNKRHLRFDDAGLTDTGIMVAKVLTTIHRKTRKNQSKQTREEGEHNGDL